MKIFLFLTSLWCKVVGLVTIYPNDQLTSLRKNIWKYYGGSVFIREGSISQPKVFGVTLEDTNSSLVKTIQKKAQNNIQLTLDGVVDFLKYHQGDQMQANYQVFKETFIVCWAGIKKESKRHHLLLACRY